ncbi:MAG: hypothetical protein AB7O59_15380 [Pirellulales bacterium]
MITTTQDAAGVSVSTGRRDAGVAEDYYSLFHWLRSVGGPSESAPMSVGITSCAPRAGVSTVAANLAIAAAQVSDQPVLLLDLGSPRQAMTTRLSAAGDGFRVVSDPAQISASIRPSRFENLSVLDASTAGSLRGWNLDCNKATELLRAVENDFGFIVVDLPPVDSSQCFVTAGALHGVLLVMEAERTRSDIAVRAKQRLADSRANILGIILNNHPQHLPQWLETRL